MQTLSPNIKSHADAWALLSTKRTNALAHDVAEALSRGSHLRTQDLAFKLQTLFNELRPYLDKSVLRDLREAHHVPTALSQAYGLGQLAFAQLLAANAAQVSASDDFTDTLQSVKYAPYIRALLGRERTSSELRLVVDEREETVSRKLRELRELGAADFRRDGREVVNFLTPLAKEIASRIFSNTSPEEVTGKLRDQLTSEMASPLKVQRIANLFGVPLEKHMKTLPIMGTKEKLEHVDA